MMGEDPAVMIFTAIALGKVALIVIFLFAVLGALVA